MSMTDGLRNDWTIEEISDIYNQPLLELLFRAAAVHRWTVHRGTSQCRPHRVPGELRGLSWRGFDGISTIGRIRLRRQQGDAHDA